MVSKEIPSRFIHITNLARQDGIEPEEYVKRVFQQYIHNKSPFINPSSKFVALGIDGLSNAIFPSGSFDTQNEAFSWVAQNESEGGAFGYEDSTIYQVFTMEGVHVPNIQKASPANL